MKTIRVAFRGRVQGVFMRKYVKRCADRAGVVGTAENKKSGEVEVFACGTEDALNAFIEECKKGSLLAHIESVKVYVTHEDLSDAKGFTIIRSSTSVIGDKCAAFLTWFQTRVLQRNAFSVLPQHVVIIPDGNRRFAKRFGWLPFAGHSRGSDRMVELVEVLFALDIPYVTAWGFSTENWKREKAEVDALMNIFLTSLYGYEKWCVKYDIRFYHFGRTDRIPIELREALAQLEEKTKSYSTYHLAFAIDYGGEDEVVRATEKMIRAGDTSLLPYLDSKQFPDVDLVIRTGGEQRTSGMMPLSTMYAEYIFSPLYFPQFTVGELYKALKVFERRKRRFGR